MWYVTLIFYTVLAKNKQIQDQPQKSQIGANNNKDYEQDPLQFKQNDIDYFDDEYVQVQELFDDFDLELFDEFEDEFLFQDGEEFDGEIENLSDVYHIDDDDEYDFEKQLENQDRRILKRAKCPRRVKAPSWSRKQPNLQSQFNKIYPNPQVGIDMKFTLHSSTFRSNQPRYYTRYRKRRRIKYRYPSMYYQAIIKLDEGDRNDYIYAKLPVKSWVGFNSKNAYIKFEPPIKYVNNIYKIYIRAVNGLYRTCYSSFYSFKLDLYNSKPKFNDEYQDLQSQFELQNPKTAVNFLYTFSFYTDTIIDSDQMDTVTIHYKWKMAEEDNWKPWSSDLWLQPRFLKGPVEIQDQIVMEGIAPFEDYYKTTFYVLVYGYDGIQYGQEQTELVYMWDFSNNEPQIDPTKKVLQMQFDEQYPNPQVGEHIRFDITENPFFDLDKDNILEYLIYWWDGDYDFSSGDIQLGTGTWQNLDNSQWVQFSQTGLYFDGTPPESIMDTYYTLMVNLTDQFVVSKGMYFHIDLTNNQPYIDSNIQTLQQQFDSQFPKPYLYLDLQMIFIIVKSPFKDLDEIDQLTYLISYKENEGDPWQDLTDIWITSSSDQQMLIGTPDMSKLDTKWYIGYQVTDGYKFSEIQSFIIDFTNNQPEINPSMTSTVQEQFDAQNPNPQIDQQIELSFLKVPFIDTDQDYLYYEVLYQVKDSLDDLDNWTELIDEWIYFVPKSLTFKGTPSEDLMDKFVLIKFRCTDGLKNSEYLEFQIDLANEAPYIDPNVTSLQQQFESQVSRLGIGSTIVFEIKEFPFVDPDNDEISYQVEYKDNIDGEWYELEDQWLIFTQKNRKFKGTPPVELMDTIYNLRLIGSDGYKQTDPVFLSLNLTAISPKQSPQAKTLNQQIQSIINTSIVKMKVKKNFQFQFDSSTFEDSDSGTLNYNAYYTRQILENEDTKSSNSQRRQMIADGDYPVGYFEANVINSNFVKLNSQLDSEVWMKFNPKTRTFYGTPDVSDLGTQSFMLIIDDNYKEITQNFTLTITNEAPFLALSLQEQLQSMPVINTDFQFTFQKQTFQDPDEDSLAYSASMADGSELIEELKFDEENRKIFGTLGALRGYTFFTKNPITIKITATDPAGMTAEDTIIFEVVPSAIYIIQLLIQVIGGLLSLLSLFAVTPFIHEILCKKRYEYLRRMVVKIDDKHRKTFFMQIPLIRQELKFGTKIMDKINWKKLISGKKEKQNWEFKEWIFNYFDQKSGDLNNEIFFETVNLILDQFVQKEQKKLQKEQKKKQNQIKKLEEKEKKFGRQNVNGRKLTSKRTIVFLENNMHKTQFSINKNELNVQNQTEIEMISLFQNQNQKERQNTMVTIFQGLFHKQLLEKDSNIKILFKQIKQMNYYYKYSVDIKDEKGKKKDDISSSVKDWYKNYLQIGYTIDTNELKENKFPPLLSFDFDKLKSDIQTAKQIIELEQMKKNAKKGEIIVPPQIQSYEVTDYEINILSKCVIFYAYGILEKVQAFQIEAAFGESLHIIPKEIKQIKCKLRRDEKCYKISDKISSKFSFLKLDYYDLSLKKNYILPQWIQVNIQHGVIRIQGEPQSEDISIDKMKFIIEDKSGYILKEFWVNVKGSQKLPKVQQDQIFQYIVNKNIKQKEKQLQIQKQIFKNKQENEMNINGLILKKGKTQANEIQIQNDEEKLLQNFYQSQNNDQTSQGYMKKFIKNQSSNFLQKNQFNIDEQLENDSLVSYDSQDYGEIQIQNDELFDKFKRQNTLHVKQNKNDENEKNNNLKNQTNDLEIQIQQKDDKLQDLNAIYLVSNFQSDRNSMQLTERNLIYEQNNIGQNNGKLTEVANLQKLQQNNLDQYPNLINSLDNVYNYENSSYMNSNDNVNIENIMIIQQSQDKLNKKKQCLIDQKFVSNPISDSDDFQEKQVQIKKRVEQDQSQDDHSANNQVDCSQQINNQSLNNTQVVFYNIQDKIQNMKQDIVQDDIKDNVKDDDQNLQNQFQQEQKQQSNLNKFHRQKTSKALQDHITNTYFTGGTQKKDEKSKIQSQKSSIIIKQTRKKDFNL